MPEEAKPQRLTLNDPVPLETLQQFNQLESARVEIAMRVLELEQERVRLLAGAHQLDQQQRRMFEKVLVERGLQANTPVDIDSTTGQLKLREPEKAEPEAPAAG